MDAILAICGILGGIAAIYGIAAYVKDHIQKPKELRDALAVQFYSNQKTAKDLRASLVQYAESNNAHEQLFIQGVTFNTYIALLTKTLNSDLADTTLKKALNENLTEAIIRSMSVSLDEQGKNLLMTKNYFELYFNHISIP